MSDIIDSCRTEVREFHHELEAWLRGDVARTVAVFARMEQAMARGCELIAPGGERDTRESLLERLFQSHGARPDMKIQIEDFSRVWATEDVALVRYIEWRRFGGQTTGRYSTVLFRADGGAPAGVQWQFIHETWMAGHAPQA